MVDNNLTPADRAYIDLRETVEAITPNTVNEIITARNLFMRNPNLIVRRFLNPDVNNIVNMLIQLDRAEGRRVYTLWNSYNPQQKQFLSQFLTPEMANKIQRETLTEFGVDEEKRPPTPPRENRRRRREDDDDEKKDSIIVRRRLEPSSTIRGQRLEGEGIFSDVLNYGLKRGIKYAPKVISSIATAKDFNNISSKTLATFGRYPIKGLKIIRTPISGILNTALNLISLGRWNELRKKYGYDTLFHTGLVCDLGGKDIIVEKNEVVNISPEFKISKDTQIFHINMEGKQFTLEEMVMGCKTKMGDRLFFDYDAFQNNCQIFLKNMLQTVGLYTTEVDKFLFQDLSEIYKKMPSYVSRITKFITRLGGIVSRLRGDGNVAPQRMVQEPQIPEVVKCKKNTALGNCFNKGYRVGLYLANNPSLRVRKEQLEQLAEELEIPLVDERGREKTANQLREELNLCGLNIDLLDEQTNQAEERLLENIRVRKAQNKPPLKYYRKRNRINPEPENLSLRELGFLASQYGVKGYSKMNKEQLIEALRETDYRPSTQLNQG